MLVSETYLPVLNAEIRVRAYAPATAAKGIVQIAHGMAEHSLRYQRLAEVLNAAGYFVVTSDHRGHGETKTDHQIQGHFADRNGFALAAEDLLAVRSWGVQAAATNNPATLPIFFLGHSMGSFFGQWILGQQPDRYAGFILSGTDAPGGPLVAAGHQAAKLERLRKGERVPSRVLTFLSFGAFNKAFSPARTEFDWLSRDAAEVDKYISDPLCGFPVTTQLWVDLTAALLGIARHGFHAAKTTPVYIFAGDRDPVGKAGAGPRKLYEMVRAGHRTPEHVTLTLYPDARHETLNEVNRDEVMRDVVTQLDAWLASA